MLYYNYKRKGEIFMKIKIVNLKNNKIWFEEFNSMFLMNQRINKIRYSKKLKIIAIETY